MADGSGGGRRGFDDVWWFAILGGAVALLGGIAALIEWHWLTIVLAIVSMGSFWLILNPIIPRRFRTISRIGLTTVSSCSLVLLVALSLGSNSEERSAAALYDAFASAPFRVFGDYEPRTEGGITSELTDTTSWKIWPFTDTMLTNVAIESAMVLSEGDEEDMWGLVCRFLDKDNWVAGYVGEDGSVRLIEVRDGSTIRDTEFLQVDNVRHQDWNVLRLECVGSNASLFVNHELAASLGSVNTLTGMIGLILVKWEEEGTMSLAVDALRAMERR